MVRFKLFGIPITILPWFWLTLAIIGSNKLSTLDDLFRLVLFILAGFISILVHELGHGLTIKKLGAETQIVLQAFGGFATYPQNHFNRFQDFIITAAGPAVQLLLAGVVSLILNNVPIEAPMGEEFLNVLLWISVIWAVFNLLPVFPLDGGQLLNAVLGPKRRTITHIIGILVAVAIGILGVLEGTNFCRSLHGLFRLSELPNAPELLSSLRRRTVTSSPQRPQTPARFARTTFATPAPAATFQPTHQGR